jgi:hypothetical protein
MELTQVAQKRKVSELHMTYLRAFSPNSYGMSIPYSIAKTMEIKGLIEWVPPKFGTTLYAITDKGREAVRADTETTPSD